MRVNWIRKLVKLYQSSYIRWCDFDINRSRFLEIIYFHCYTAHVVELLN